MAWQLAADTETCRYVKPGDWLILKELEKIEKMIVAQQVQTNDKLDKILALLLVQAKYVSPELEQAIKATSVHAKSIDEKVPDHP